MVLDYGRQKETRHFRFIYESKDALLVDAMSASLEECYEDLCHSFGIPDMGEQYDFYICRSVEDYIAATKKSREEYQEWMVGWADIREKRLCLLSLAASGEDFAERLEYLKQVMVHEVVHIVFDGIAKEEETECWLAEGIALYYAGQIGEISVAGCPKISEISGRGEDSAAFCENGGYDYAGIYVWYFLCCYGKEKFVQAYKNEIGLKELIMPGFESQAVRAYLEGAGNGTV